MTKLVTPKEWIKKNIKDRGEADAVLAKLKEPTNWENFGNIGLFPSAERGPVLLVNGPTSILILDTSSALQDLVGRLLTIKGLTSSNEDRRFYSDLSSKNWTDLVLSYERELTELSA
jgi:hypothetical protein